MEYSRRHALEEGVVANHTSRTYHIIALKGFLIHSRQILGFILQVAVNYGNVVTLGIGESCSDSIGLSKVATEIDAFYSLVVSANVGYFLPRIIG